MKHCARCEQWKDESEFSKNRAKKDGLQSYCKACMTPMFGQWYQSHKEAHVQYVTQRNKQTTAEIYERVYAYLKTHPCVDCGNADPRVLQFDHVRGEKINGVLALIKLGYRWDTIVEEIAKCEVRCANCHRRATAKRRGD